MQIIIDNSENNFSNITVLHNNNDVKHHIKTNRINKPLLEWIKKDLYEIVFDFFYPDEDAFIYKTKHLTPDEVVEKTILQITFIEKQLHKHKKVAVSI
jgi:hypothetical protein